MILRISLNPEIKENWLNLSVQNRTEIYESMNKLGQKLSGEDELCPVVPEDNHYMLVNTPIRNGNLVLVSNRIVIDVPYELFLRYETETQEQMDNVYEWVGEYIDAFDPSQFIIHVLCLEYEPFLSPDNVPFFAPYAAILCGDCYPADCDPNINIARNSKKLAYIDADDNLVLFALMTFGAQSARKEFIFFSEKSHVVLN